VDQDNRDRESGEIAAGGEKRSCRWYRSRRELAQVVQCFDLRKQVGELRGFEPLTPSMPWSLVSSADVSRCV
jgi:hypothetical protein